MQDGNGPATVPASALDARRRATENQPRVSLREWSHAWVSEEGRPTIRTDLALSAGRVAQLTFRQSDPYARRGLIWPQRLEITLGYPHEERTVRVDLDGATADVTAAAGMAVPLYILPNGRGRGYGRFVLDGQTLSYLVEHVEEIDDPLSRGSAWVTLWDAMLEREVSPARFADVCLRAVAQERDEQLTQRVLGYLEKTYWKFLDGKERLALAPRLEATVRDGLARAEGASLKSAWFSAFRDMALSPQAVAWLERVWRRQEPVPGLTFSESDDIAMAQELAVRDVAGAPEILTAQHARIANPDRKARFAFVMPALSGDQNVRDRFVTQLADPANRRHEPWVLDGLQYVHHPLRAAASARYVVPALEMLPEIQRTGDIFFPKRWSDAVLGGHSVPSTADAVRRFIDRLPPDYPVRLRKILLSSDDELFRAGAR